MNRTGCELSEVTLGSLAELSQAFRELFNDRRLYQGFVGTLQGILAAGSLQSCIARFSPSLAATPHAEKRVRNLVHGEGKRNELRAEALARKLAETAQAQLAGEAEVLCIIDGSDLRKRYATSLEHLDQVRDLEGKLVAGYPTMNVLGIGASGKRALLYHRLYSSCAPGFKSRNREIAEALGQSHERLKVAGMKRWVVVDREFDDAKVYQQLSAQGDDYLICVRHEKRLVRQGESARSVAEVSATAALLARVQLRL